MERVRSLTRARVLGLTAAIAAVALGGAGCQSAAKTRDSMYRAVGLGKPAPVAQFMCVVEPGLQMLPDVTRNGAPTPVLLGKAFLFGQDSQPTEADGELTVMVTDTTPRAPGTPPKNVQYTNFDAATMKKLRAGDERLGRHYLFPIPWPADWADVTQVVVQAQYKPNPESKLPTMYHPAVKVSIAQGPLQVTDKLTGQPAGAGVGVGLGGLGNGVPDPDRLRQMIAAGGQPPATGMPGIGMPNSAALGTGLPGLTGPNGNTGTIPAGGMTFPQMPTIQQPPVNLPVAPAGGGIPPSTTFGANGSRTTTAAWVGPAPGAAQSLASTPPQVGLGMQPGFQQPALQPPAGFGSQPAGPQMPATLPPLDYQPPAARSDDGGLRSITIPRQ